MSIASACSRRGRLGALLLSSWLLGATACEKPSAGPPTLAQLAAESDVKAAGRSLMAMPMGTHRLDTTTPAPNAVAIGVHGHGSEGYEWVYPLTTLGQTGVQVRFHRWDYDQCPEPMAAELDQSLDAMLAEQPSIERVQLLAHSYGGVVAAMVAARYDGKVPLTVDVVASPLAGMEQLRTRCGYQGPTPPAAGVTLRQWRTRQELDGAFEALAVDPQVVELPGEVRVLPETYKGHRLGHNWSISWVVDELGGGAPP